MHLGIYLSLWTLGLWCPNVISEKSNCMRLTTYNYHYTRPYSLDELNSGMVDGGLSFNFSVRAPSDGHLMLSAYSNKSLSPVTVEIVLGAGANTFTAVRRKPKKTSLDYTVSTVGILSSEEMRDFCLILEDNRLTLYSGNDSVILQYEDSAIVSMTYVSFGAWNNVGVEWMFDCRGTDGVSNRESSSDPAFRFMTDFWSNYDNFNPPVGNNDSLVVYVSLHLIHVNLNAKDSLFTLTGKFNISWTAEKLEWDPEAFGNLTYMNFKQRVLWMPDFVLMDDPKLDRSLLDDKAVRWSSDGNVQWSPSASIETWCDVDMTDWPNDEHTCVVHIGLRSHPKTVQVKLNNEPDEKSLKTSGMEWFVVSITAEEVTVLGSEDENSQSFKLRVTMKRIVTSYLLLFVLPLLVCFVVLSATFTIPPQHKSRLILVSGCTIVLYVLLLTESEMLPAVSQGTPRVMKIACTLLLVAIVQLIFHCFNFHIANNTVPAPHFVQRAAKKPWMKYLQRATYDSFVSDDVRKNEDQLPEPEGGADLTSTARAVVNKYHWGLVSRALDLIIFTLMFFVLPFSITAV